MRVELGLATVNSDGATRWKPNPSTFDVRADADLDAGGLVRAASSTSDAPGGERVPMLRLRVLDGAAGRFFPGATLAIAGAASGASAASLDSGLAREGFLRGALNVRIPALQVRGERLLHIAADGSLYDAADADGALVAMPRADTDILRLGPAAPAATGPGVAWPPLPAQAEPRMLSRVPAAPGRGPAVMHGARVLKRVGTEKFDELPAGDCALTFAVQIAGPGGPRYRPFQRLRWEGSQPTAATWAPLDRRGAAVDLAAGAAEYAEIARLRDGDPDGVALAVRFECTQAKATLCPGEVAWTADDGRTILVHLPQLDARPAVAADRWPAPAPPAFVSDPVRVAEDGSTWAASSTAGRRVSLGSVAPVAGDGTLRRRRVRWRRLCAWDSEHWEGSPPMLLPPTAPGRLDVDVKHGLFAFAGAQPPQAWPIGPGGAAPPPSVTTDYEEGATMHIGARPAAREPVLDLRLGTPTRLVSRSGALHPDAPAGWHDIPRYSSLRAALDAVAADWAALTPADLAGSETVAEVVQFEDSATYAAEAPDLAVGPDRRRRRAARADDPGRRARAAGRARRRGRRVEAAGAADALRVDHAARHRARRRGLGGHVAAAGRARRDRALQRPARDQRPDVR